MDTLTRMRTFVQVVESGGFSAAGRDLGRSKALISKYVRELEDELGVRLLNRTTRKLSLTEAGTAYYREAADIVQRITDLNESVGESQSEPRGVLRITAPRAFGERGIGKALIDFLVEQPNIRISLFLDDRLVDVVDEGFDVAIRMTQLEDSSLIARKLVSMRTITCAAPSFVERHGEPSHPRELSDLPCIVDTNLRSPGLWAFEKDGRRMSVSINGPVEVNSPIVARQMAVAGVGIAMVPAFLVDEDIADGRLISFLEGFERPMMGVYAVYPHRRHLSVKVRVFVDFLVRWFDHMHKEITRRRAAGERFNADRL